MPFAQEKHFAPACFRCSMVGHLPERWESRGWESLQWVSSATHWRSDPKLIQGKSVVYFCGNLNLFPVKCTPLSEKDAEDMNEFS